MDDNSTMDPDRLQAVASALTALRGAPESSDEDELSGIAVLLADACAKHDVPVLLEFTRGLQSLYGSLRAEDRAPAGPEFRLAETAGAVLGLMYVSQWAAQRLVVPEV